MSDFLGRLLDRSFASMPTLRPRRRTVFEPVVETSLDPSGTDDAIGRQNREPTNTMQAVPAQGTRTSDAGTAVDWAAQSTASADTPRKAEAQSHALPSPVPRVSRGLDARPRTAATPRVSAEGNKDRPTRAGSLMAAVERSDDMVHGSLITQEIAPAMATDQGALPIVSTRPWTPATAARGESADFSGATTRARSVDDAWMSPRGSGSTRSGDSPERPVSQVRHESAPNGSSPAPQVTVTIGRVEIRAPQSPPMATPARKPPQLSLDQYLRQRGGGRRS